MRSFVKKISVIAVMVCLVVAFMPMMGGTVKAKTIKLNKKTVYIVKGKTYKLKVKGTKKKVKWTTSDKKVATVTKKGKVKAKGYGECTITAKVKGKKLTCKVYVITKAGKKAKAFRSYILKKGKYIKSEEAYRIKKTITTTEGDKTVMEIYAKKDSFRLTFQWSYSPDSPMECDSVAVYINLITGKTAFKQGTFLHQWEEYYSELPYRQLYLGVITTNFEDEDEGFKLLSAFDIPSDYDEDGNIVEKPKALSSDECQEKAGSVADTIEDALEDMNKLTKKAGKSYTMKAIGFKHM